MKYHFIGIKGSGMSSLAQIMFDLGFDVQGSDSVEHFFTQIALDERGIKLLPYDEENINEEMIVVIGASIKEDNVELKKAKELNIKKYSYYELLGELTNKYNTIAVCGCHGKTSTTSLLAHVFNNIIGSNYLIGDGTGLASDNNSYFLIEACEYRRHFLYYYPKTTIVTNIDLDHIDYFKDLDDVKDAYINFLNQTEKQIIVCGDDKNIRDIKDKINKPIYLYGIGEDNDFRASNITSSTKGFNFDVFFKDKLLGNFNINSYGKHSILNALSVIAASYLEGLDINQVRKYLMTYEGAKRRFSQTIINDTVIIDDYAHHPNEIKAVIEAARQKYPDKDIISVFLPHTFSRIKALHKEIAKELNKTFKSYILDIYPSREQQEDFPGVTRGLILDLLKNGEELDKEDLSKLKEHSNSVIIFMSPNDMATIIDSFKLLFKKDL